jgi:hypothetical protein
VQKAFTNKTFMDSEMYGLDLDVLQKMYQAEANRLNAELLSGASWESVREQKKRVIDLAIIIHKKKNPQYFNPAEFSSSRKNNEAPE